MEKKYLKNEYQKIITEIQSIINKYDPWELISIGAPDDEYSTQINQIIRALKELKTEDEIAKEIEKIFTPFFHEKTIDTLEYSKKITTEIIQLKIKYSFFK